MTSPWDTLQQLQLPDGWQMEAVRALQAARDVIVQAPTGSGKTFIFEQFYKQSRPARQSIYTAPTRALANDKYAEWKRLGWEVGITTGDLVRDPDAPLVVATLEAQQHQQQAALFVIDEYQWLCDEGRGHHYEGTLLSLPPATQLLLLSGSVSNPDRVADWLRRMGRSPQVIVQKERPVPLDEFDVESAARAVDSRITGFWMRCLAGALHENLGPILVFAPHRKDAEKIARQAAASLPCLHPLRLTAEQEALAGPELARLLSLRVAYHHSGLTYAQRAGLVEPLAKAGQLRVVAATLGLSAGINFSLRSVLVTSTSYSVRGIPQEVTPSELLQMFGRAGRRGLDDCGYVLVTRRSARLGQSSPQHLRRSKTLPWHSLLRSIAGGESCVEATARFQKSLFSESPILLGLESTSKIPEPLPCNLRVDAARARLVRRKNEKGKPCPACAHRKECHALSPSPTLLWWFTRLRLLTRTLEITPRGRAMSQFLGPEGLGVIAGIEDPEYPLEELLNDCGNLFASDRFCGAEPRWQGRLANACTRLYENLNCEGFLENGLPLGYGWGGSEIIALKRQKKSIPPELLGELAHRGDVDRLWIEWKSLMRQIAHADDVDLPRWKEWQALCRRESDLHAERELPTPPPLTAEQLRTVSHRL